MDLHGTMDYGIRNQGKEGFAPLMANDTNTLDKTRLYEACKYGALWHRMK